MHGPLHPLIYGSKFGLKDIPSQKGKIFIVSGGNTGIGYETVKALYAKDAKVYIASRTKSKADAAIAKLKQEVKSGGELIYLEVDLMNLESVKNAAALYSKSEDRLDVLINNAGIMAVDYKLTKDGYDQQIQTNHLAPFLFTHLLLPKLEAAPEPRIVNVSSIAHSKYFSDSPKAFSSLEHINSQLSGKWERYGQSKIANILFSQSLTTRYPKIHINSCHPGFIASDLYDHLGFGLMGPTMKLTAMTGLFLNTPDGALTQLFLATSPEIVSKGIKGKYYQPIAQPKVPSSAANETNANKLWKLSEEAIRKAGFELSL